MRDHRCWREPTIGIDHSVDAIGCEDFQDSHEGRIGQGMGVLSQIERSSRVLQSTVFTDRLSDRYNVVLIEASLQGRATMA